MLDTVDIYLSFAKEFYSDKDVAHNFNHITRICNTSKRIIDFGVNQPVNSSLLYFLIAFHGLGRRLENDEDFLDKTKEFLITNGWSEIQFINALSSLKTHCRAPKTIEEFIVHDANYIEAFGAFGLARAFNSAGTRGQSVEEILEIMETHYYHKIEFKTPYGIKVSENLRHFTNIFTQELKKEIEWYKGN